MAFSLNRKVAGLGKVDKGQVQGFYLHPVLCLDAESGACYGVAALTFLHRHTDNEALTSKQIKAIRSRTAFEDKESYRWYSSIKEALNNCPCSVKKTVVADREADIYPLLTGLVDLGVDYVIRSRHNRPLQHSEKLYDVLEGFTEEHRFSMPVPATDKRSAHKAVLKVSFGKVELKESKGKSHRKLAPSHGCWVVKVEEDSCSVIGNQEPIKWILLTSHPVDSVEKALRIVGYYKQRWNIEQVFRILKRKGLCFEQSQLRGYEKLQKLMLLALMASVKVLQLIRARDGTTNQHMSEVFTEQEQQLLKKLNPTLEGNTEKQKNPYEENSLAFAAWVIARLSGWGGYQSQKPAGPNDFLTGLQLFEERLQGYKLAYIT
jgi:hypothetical protein